MATKDFLPKTDAALQQWAANFATVAKANLVALGIAQKDIDAFVLLNTTFNNDIGAVTAQKKNLKSATENKNTDKSGITTQARAFSKSIQAKAGVSDALKAQLGLTVNNGHTKPVAPQTPTNLVANGYDTGTNILKWNRNGNANNVQFVIEAQFAADANWTLVNVVTATRFDHTGQVPGQKVIYRVSARRKDQTSDPSNQAVVYGAATALKIVNGFAQAA